MQKCSRIIAGFLTVLIIVSLTACSAGNENPAAKTESDEAVLSDLTVYSYTWRMAEFLDDSSYDEYMHDDGQRFQSLMSFTEKLRSSEELAFTPYTSNLVELLNLTVPAQCKVNYGTDFIIIFSGYNNAAYSTIQCKCFHFYLQENLFY